MKNEIYKGQSRAWNQEWVRRFGDGSVIKVDEFVTGHVEKLIDRLRVEVPLTVVPRGLVFDEGELGVLTWILKGNVTDSASISKEETSSMLYLSSYDFIDVYLASLPLGENIIKLYRYDYRAYPMYYKSKKLRRDNTSLEEVLHFEVEDFPMYVREGNVFHRVKDGKYLMNLMDDALLKRKSVPFITVYPDGTVHSEAHSLETLYARFLTGELSRWLYGESVVIFHRLEYRKFVGSKEYQLLAGRNRITRADCGIKEVVTEGTNLGAVVLKDFVANNGVCRTVDDIDFVDISRLSNDIKVLDLSACEHLRGVRIDLYKLEGLSLFYPNSENYRDGEFKLNKCNRVNIQGEIRATDVVVYDSEFSSDDLFIQMFPQGLQNVVTNTRCLFNGVTGLKRLSVHSTEQPAYDYDYEVSIDLIKTSVEELSIDFAQESCRLKLYINKCSSLRKVFIHCEGTVALSDIWNLLSNNSNELELRVVCGILEVRHEDVAKLKHNNSRQKMFAGVKCSVEASRLIWKGYAVGSPRNKGADLGFNYLPESVRGIIARRER